MSDADKLHRSIKPVSVGMLTMAADQIIEAIKVRDKAIEALKARVVALEMATVAHSDAHEVGKTYAKGTRVVYDGNLWRANYTTASRPGHGPAWTLTVNTLEAIP